MINPKVLGFFIMGKRSNVVVLSSDGDDEEEHEDNESLLSLNRRRSYCKLKSKPFVTRTNPRESKKPRLSDSRSRFGKQSKNLDEVSFIDNFYVNFCLI